MNSQADMTALREVTALEGGRIINEHYTFEEYVQRRGRFLGRHPLYKHRTTGLFPLARSDAEAVFQTDREDLSVQEVRRREIREEIDPLLPLPTMENTESIDGFCSYPRSEWDPSNPTAAATPTMLSANITNATTMLEQTAGTYSEDMYSSPVPSLPSLTHSHPSSMSTLTSTPILASSQYTSSSPASAGGTERRLPSWPGYHLPPAHPKVVQQILNRLGKPPMPAASVAQSRPNTTESAFKRSTTVYNHQEVASLQSRGMRREVKKKQGVKRAASPALEDDADTEASEANMPASMMEPPIKKQKLLKLLGPKKPEEPLKKVKKSASNSKARLETQSHFERVIAGLALPKTREEAKSAAEERYNRLAAHHKLLKQSRSDRKRNTNTPDILPEFFKAENFRKGHEDSEIRCVCSAVDDDGEAMVCCDSCNVWQHMDCMGEAVPANAEKEAYACQMCDPFVHRRLLANLRVDNQLRM